MMTSALTRSSWHGSPEYARMMYLTTLRAIVIASATSSLSREWIASRARWAPLLNGLPLRAVWRLLGLLGGESGSDESSLGIVLRMKLVQ